MKEYLEKLIAAKKKKIEELRNKIKTAETADEVRSLGESLDTVTAEMQEAQTQLEGLNVPKGEERSNFNPNGMLSVGGATMNEQRDSTEDPLGTMEYRTAFMNYVQRGTVNDVLRKQMERRTADDQNESTDLGILLPSTVIQQIIKDVEKVYGQLYSRVKKTNIKGGVKYPIGSFSATFHRITENGAPTARQNAGSIDDDYVSFTYNIGEIRIAQTLLANVLSVPVFEAELAKTIVEAYVKAMDKEIMTGVATNNEMEGILTEAGKVSSRINASHIIEFTEDDMKDWKSWQTKLFAKIPLSMRSLRPEFVMTANTYEANIKTLHDDNNRPVYSETFNPVDGAEISRFKGRDVVFVEEDILGNFNDIDVGDESTDSPYFGMYWVPEQAYAINTNLEFFVKRYFDDEKNQWVDKALVINDGKVLDPKYIYLLKKVATEVTA